MRIRITLLLLLSCYIVSAQEALSIGDPVPEVRFASVLNHSSKTAKLSDFKNRLVILDFWSTRCGSCLHAFPKMDSLQKAFGKELKVLLVNNKSTGDDLSRVQEFFKKWQARTGSKLNLTAIVNDTITEKLFPHQLLPHYVWIGKNGTVLAITSSDAVTAANIRSAINEETIGLTTKKDQNTERPIFLDKDLGVDQLVSYAILVKGWYEGLPSGNRTRERGDTVCGRAMLNTALLDMYRSVARGIDPSIKEKQFVVITKDSSEIFPPTGGEERTAWFKQHAYSMDVVVPPGESTQLFQRMLEALNRGSGYEGRFETRKEEEGARRVFVLMKR